jgi:GntR family transcriptional regulator
VKSTMLDKKSYIPLYHQLAEKLREMVSTLHFEAGRSLPSEHELCETYGISRGTVREALRILNREGLIERQRGLGTFVASTKIVHESNKVMSFSRVISATGKVPRAKVLAFRQFPAPDYVRNKLQLAPGEDIVFLQRLRYGDQEPLLLEHSYFRIEIGQRLNDLDLRGPIYDILEKKFGYVFKRSEHIIEASLVTKPDGKLLGLAAGKPVLIMNRLVLLSDDTPVEYAEDIYRADRTKFKINTTREQYAATGGMNAF